MSTPDDEVEFTGADMSRQTDVIGLVRQSLTIPTRTEFEAAAYRHLRMAGLLSSHTPVITLARYIKGKFQNEHDVLMGEGADTAIAAAMGWGTVPEQAVKS